MTILLQLVIHLLWATVSVKADGFVVNVLCSNEGMTVVLDPTEESVAKWVADPAAQPVVYVLNHKSRMPCGSSLKNDRNETNFNLTIPFGDECNVRLTDLEPNFVTAETNIVVEDNADEDVLGQNVQKIHHVFCLYTKQVEAMRQNVITPQHEPVASTGGKPEPTVTMVFRSTSGAHLTTAKYGDEIEFYVALTPDAAYHGIVPIECAFSNHEDVSHPGSQQFTFVKSYCPLKEVQTLIEPLKNVNDEVFFSKFKSFRFGNQSSVFVHCTVKVCMNAKDCRRACYQRVENSKLNAERLLFRHRRSTSRLAKRETSMNAEMTISNKINVLSQEETNEFTLAQRSPAAVESCSLSSSATSTVIMAVLGGLIMLTAISIGFAIYFGMKLRKTKGDSFDLVSAYTATTSVVSLPTGSSYGHPRHPYSYGGNEFR